MALLNRLKVRGFRSIKEMDLELRSLNVLIGANGAGKSNLVAFFKLLNEMMGSRLQQYIATTGHARANLYFGPKVTPQVEGELVFKTDNGTDTYFMRLFHAAGDTLVFAEESLSFLRDDWTGEPRRVNLGAGHKETRISDEAMQGEPIAKVIRQLLNRCRVFHFHDTSSTAHLRQYCYVGDHRWLMPDAANLAAMLYRWRRENETVYRRIVKTVGQIAPFFVDFDLPPDNVGVQDVILNWRHRTSASVFGPHQVSDGTLRAICLVALLLQPEDELPDVIVVDEPELGLHPYALNVIASLFKAAAHRTQILISTQSSTLLDNFEPEDVVIVERDGEGSGFSRPSTEKLREWMEDYSLGEVWEKNVMGGGPH